MDWAVLPAIDVDNFQVTTEEGDVVGVCTAPWNQYSGSCKISVLMTIAAMATSSPGILRVASRRAPLTIRSTQRVRDSVILVIKGTDGGGAAAADIPACWRFATPIAARAANNSADEGDQPPPGWRRP